MEGHDQRPMRRTLREQLAALDLAAATRRAVAVSLAGVTAWTAQSPRSFEPFADPDVRLVNAISFAPDGNEMFMALLHQHLLKARGLELRAGTPEVGIYLSRRTADGTWGAPSLWPMSGTYEDFEPTLSPDGRILLFNSRRPDARGVIPASNDLWMSVRNGTSWGAPRRVDELDTEDDESYPTLSADGRLVYHTSRLSGAVRSYDLFEARLVNGRFADRHRSALSTDDHGEGDPWIAADGSYVIFTRWKEDPGWETTCDLYVAFREKERWGTPVPLELANTPGPDFSPGVSPDGQRFYYRASYQYVERALKPLLDDARRRALG